MITGNQYICMLSTPAIPTLQPENIYMTYFVFSDVLNEVSECSDLKIGQNVSDIFFFFSSFILNYTLEIIVYL